MRMATVLISSLLAGCAGQESVTVAHERDGWNLQRSLSVATQPAFSHDLEHLQGPRTEQWPFGPVAAQTVARTTVNTDPQGGYRLMARLSPFDHDGAELPESVRAELTAIAQALLRQPVLPTVLLVGHTDAAGSAAYNQRLSQQRARSAARYLVAQGVASRRIQAVGFGENSPLTSRLSSDSDRKNRRVEIFTFLPAEFAAANDCPCLQAERDHELHSTAKPTAREVTK